MDSNSKLFEQADQLVQKGNYRQAIALLESAGSYDNHELAKHLIDLRVQAFSQVNWPDPNPDWPPPHDNRFDSVHGFPEVDASELDVGALRAGIMGKGGLIVRGLMNSDRIQDMRENIDKSLRAKAESTSKKPANKSSPWYRRSNKKQGGPVQFSGGERSAYTGSMWSVDSPTVSFQLIDYFRQIGLPALLTSYFDEDPVLSVRKWVLRCIAPNNGASSGWHQDGYFLGDASTIRTVNLWIALTDCGGDEDAPGLEIIGGGDRKIYETGTRGSPFDWTVGQQLVDEIAQTNPVLCPTFKAGDGLFFDHYNLHRTGFGLNHTNNRYAIESWFFAGSTAPLKQQPVVI